LPDLFTSLTPATGGRKSQPSFWFANFIRFTGCPA
jgi:hypothetical protein